MNDRISLQIIQLNKYVNQINKKIQQGKPIGNLIEDAKKLSEKIDTDLKSLAITNESNFASESDKLQNDFKFLRSKLHDFSAAVSSDITAGINRNGTHEVFPLKSDNPSQTTQTTFEPHVQINETQSVQQQTQSSDAIQLSSQQQENDVIDQDEITYQTQLQQERHVEIQQLHRDVTDVNQIFQQLNTMLVQQGEQVDTVDENTNLLLDNVQRANTQLSKAKDKQRTSMCCRYILFIVLFLLLLLLLLL